jgi:hypothetical protein
MSQRPTLLFSAFAALLLLSCGGDDGLMTLGDACSQISGPACDRAIACGQGRASERQDCLDVFMDACCRDAGNCGREAKDKDAAALLQKYADNCSGAFPTWDCAKYDMGTPPPQCTMVPSSALTLRDEPMSRLPATGAEESLPMCARRIGTAVGRSVSRTSTR